MFRKIILRLAVLTLGILAATAYLASSTPANAASDGLTFTVNSFADTLDANPGDGVCADTNGKCTLRAAILEANALAGTDTIQLDAGTYQITRVGADDTGSSGDFDITQDLILQGKGADLTTIDAVSKDRVFDLLANTNVQMSDLRIYRGSATNSYGGGARIQGASATFTRVLFDTNFAAQGGGIFNNSATVYLDRVTMKFNHAVSFGGGIMNSAVNAITEGTIWIYNSTLFTNYASSGAGIYDEAMAYLFNSTLSGNRAKTDGGGIQVTLANLNPAPPVAVDLSNVTITANLADEDQNGTGDGGGVNVNGQLPLTLRNTIIAANRDMTAGGVSESQPHDCAGKLGTAGYNLIRNGYGCGGITHNQNGDQFGNALFQVEPHLNALADNGGSTLTHSLQSNSPAIDRGNPAGCKLPNQAPLLTDQRNYYRPVDGGTGTGRCDIGALEYNATPAPDCTTTKPAAVALLAPINNTMVQTKKPLLTWSAVNCAQTYKIVVRQDSKKGAKVFVGQTGLTERQTSALTKGHTYYWLVKACGIAGCSKGVRSSFSIKP